MKSFSIIIKNEFLGWKWYEILWLIFCAVVISVTASFFKDSAIGIIGAICGITASVLTGKGKLSAYVIGGIGRILYAIIAYKTKFYGEVMLNLLYFVPMEFYGIYVWNKNMNHETHEVNKRSMNKGQVTVLCFAIAAVTVAYGFLLKHLGSRLPFVDSFTNTVSVIAMIVTIKMFWQQWVLWLVVNVVSCGMWVYSFVNGTGSVAILLMWIIYLANSTIMLIKWKKASEN